MRGWNQHAGQQERGWWIRFDEFISVAVPRLVAEKQTEQNHFFFSLYH